VAVACRAVRFRKTQIKRPSTRDLARALGGDLTADRAEGDGAVLRLRLPAR